MEFPVCPACHQSVIDDDAVDCPFCGASMKGKPSSKSVAKPVSAAPKSAAAGAKPAAQTVNSNSGKSGSGKSGGGAPTLPGDDFPFDIELTSGKAAIPAMPNPTKQRSWKVICPMCDTPGYLPATAAGHDVRCANTKCVMPVFTAPLPPKKEVAAPPPPRKSNLLLFGIIGIVLLGVCGGRAYWWLNQPPGKKELTPEQKAEMAAMVGNNQPRGNNPQNAVPGQAPKAAEAEANPGVDIEARIVEVLKLMDDACLNNTGQTNKPYCRRLTAEANAISGNSKSFRNHLDRMITVGGAGLSYYQIVPLLELYWTEFASGDNAKASKTLKIAMSEAAKIPVASRDRYEISARLAAALVSAGREPDAEALLTEMHSADADAQLAARLQIATDGHVGLLSDGYSVLHWKFPLRVAVTASLINRGQSASALKWASGQTEEDAKAECLAYWVEDVTRRTAAMGAIDPNGVIAEAIKDLAPVHAARVWARAGCGRLSKKDLEAVAEAIKLAQAQLDQVGALPESPEIPADVKSTNRFKLPAKSTLYLQAATAAAEITFLQAQSKTTIDDAEKSLELTLKYVDATAPSLAAILKVFADTNAFDEVTGTFDMKRLKEFVKAKTKEKRDNIVHDLATNYKDALTRIRSAAQQRFDLERQLLSRLRGAGVGLNSKVWIIVDKRRRSAEDSQKNDDFFLNPLAGELVEGLKGTNEGKAVQGAWTQKTHEPAPLRPVVIEFDERIAQKDYSKAVELVEASGPRSSQRDEIFLQAACRLADAKKLAEVFGFVPNITDRTVREDCYRLAAAIAVKRDLLEDVWKEAQEVAAQTDRIAICRGMIQGLKMPED